MSAIGFHITAITELKTVGPAKNTTTKEFGILPNTFLLQRCLLSQFAYENSLFKFALQSTMHSIQVQVIKQLAKYCHMYSMAKIRQSTEKATHSVSMFKCRGSTLAKAQKPQQGLSFPSKDINLLELKPLKTQIACNAKMIFASHQRCLPYFSLDTRGQKMNYCRNFCILHNAVKNPPTSGFTMHKMVYCNVM